MSQEEYCQLCNVLEKIATKDCNTLSAIYENYGGAVEKLNDAWHNYSKVDINFKDFENCYEAFDKKCKRIK